MEFQESISRNRRTRKRQIPSFGNWEYYDEDFPVTQYFESAHHLFAADADLFEAPPLYVHRKELDEKKPGRAWRCDSTNQQVKKRPKAVDEDLYKIPPEIECRKPKRGMVVSDFWRRCFGLSCIP